MKHGRTTAGYGSGVALGALVAFAACGRGRPGGQAGPDAGPDLRGVASAQTAISDAELTRAVQRRLDEEPTLARARIEVASTGGIVTLTGSAANLLASDRAAKVAETLKGVRAVVDRVAVAPPPVPDARVLRDLDEAFRRNPATARPAIGASVHEGVVTLRGTADSWQQKRLFEDVAEATTGVKRIDDQLALRQGAARPDREIAADVEQRVRYDAWLDGFPIEVHVVAGVVHLQGTVGSVATKRRATTDAWVAGVHDVDGSGLGVDWRARARARRSPYRHPTDAEIAGAVREAFGYDPRVGTLVPSAGVEGGVVRLEGTLDGIRAQRAATEDARDTVGVTDVRDDTRIAPSGVGDDSEIARRIEGALSGDSLVPDARSLRVSVAGGRVAVEGPVRTSLEGLAVLGDIERVPGVVAIDNRLVAQSEVHDVQSAIEDELRWDPLVVGGRVQVHVSPDRTATLTGTVDSWSELRAATADAVAGGATHVIDLLQRRNERSYIEP